MTSQSGLLYTAGVCNAPCKQQNSSRGRSRCNQTRGCRRMRCRAAGWAEGAPRGAGTDQLRTQRRQRISVASQAWLAATYSLHLCRRPDRQSRVHHVRHIHHRSEVRLQRHVSRTHRDYMRWQHPRAVGNASISSAQDPRAARASQHPTVLRNRNTQTNRCHPRTRSATFSVLFWEL